MVRTRCFCLIAVSIALAGCDGNRGYVSGVVSLNGRPLPRGMVQFIPVAETETATGVIQADGRYQLRSDDRDGLPPGKYRVRIDAREAPKNEADTLPASLVPEKYLSAESSGLEFDVQKGRQEINLTLAP